MPNTQAIAANIKGVIERSPRAVRETEATGDGMQAALFYLSSRIGIMG